MPFASIAGKMFTLVMFMAIDEVVSSSKGTAGAVIDDYFAMKNLTGMLEVAAQGKGNFGIGSATYEQAEAMGYAWVGEGYKVASDGRTLVSADLLR